METMDGVPVATEEMPSFPADEFSSTIIPPAPDMSGDPAPLDPPNPEIDQFAMPEPAPFLAETSDTADFSAAPPEPPTSDAFGMPEPTPVMPPTSDGFGMPEPTPVMPPTSDGFGMPEPTPAMDPGSAFNAAWEQRLREQEEEETRAKQTLKESADRFLDEFHDTQTDKKLAKMESNRKTQDETAAENGRLLEEAQRDGISQWKRVFDLVDSEKAATSAGENDRMFKLLVNLKIKGVGKIDSSNVLSTCRGSPNARCAALDSARVFCSCLCQPGVYGQVLVLAYVVRDAACGRTRAIESGLWVPFLSVPVATP
eukprot:CAMPEP_0172644792 /NCGR_PEP_ID=MMETSP1068-20121228/239398_1 /TAXON_ID=35684 /ORGANISM="Pseudopedinella elastica, Strain CCMP716" /LENGTH=312 /DNA_ID=CAMNT_0013459007 /DNA_START=49 /DNA_END=985 /DNA_ORIENTATION=-